MNEVDEGFVAQASDPASEARLPYRVLFRAEHSRVDESSFDDEYRLPMLPWWKVSP